MDNVVVTTQAHPNGELEVQFEVPGEETITLCATRTEWLSFAKMILSQIDVGDKGLSLSPTHHYVMGNA